MPAAAEAMRGRVAAECHCFCGNPGGLRQEWTQTAAAERHSAHFVGTWRLAARRRPGQDAHGASRTDLCLAHPSGICIELLQRTAVLGGWSAGQRPRDAAALGQQHHGQHGPGELSSRSTLRLLRPLSEFREMLASNPSGVAFTEQFRQTLSGHRGWLVQKVWPWDISDLSLRQQPGMHRGEFLHKRATRSGGMVAHPHQPATLPTHRAEPWRCICAQNGSQSVARLDWASARRMVCGQWHRIRSRERRSCSARLAQSTSSSPAPPRGTEWSCCTAVRPQSSTLLAAGCTSPCAAAIGSAGPPAQQHHPAQQCLG